MERFNTFKTFFETFFMSGFLKTDPSLCTVSVSINKHFLMEAILS